jgi:DNA-binding PucR family transcriptional regulator
MRSIESSLNAIAEGLEEHIDALVDEMLERMRVEIADFAAFEHPELDDATRRSAYANVRAGLSSLVAGRAAAGLAPAEAEDGARRAARLGMDLPQLLQTYRVGHAVAWEHVHSQIDALEIDDDTRREMLRLASRYLFAYVDAVVPLVTEVYTRERDALLRSGEHRRRRVLRDLLDGTRTDAGELGYDLRGDHVGAIAWGEQADEALRALGRALDAPSLVIDADEEFVWAWFTVRAPDGPQWARRVAAFTPPERTAIALGSVGAGIEGFRRTHREAQRAYLVARHRSAPVTRFDDVVVEALAMRDEAAARELVARELGPLAADDARSATLRETLQAYFETSSNASAAAALLGVNDRTVAYRLRGIEDLLGYPVSTRSLELRIALRLRALLSGGAP